MSCCLRFVAQVAIFDDFGDLFLQLATIVVSLDPARGLEDSLVSVNGVFVEALDQLDLKLFRDLDLAVVPWWFFSLELFDLLGPVLVLDLVHCV